MACMRGVVKVKSRSGSSCVVDALLIFIDGLLYHVCAITTVCHTFVVIDCFAHGHCITAASHAGSIEVVYMVRMLCLPPKVTADKTSFDQQQHVVGSWIDARGCCIRTDSRCMCDILYGQPRRLRHRLSMSGHSTVLCATVSTCVT